MRERGDREQYDDREKAHQEAHEIGRAVHARGEQRFVALDLLDVRVVAAVVETGHRARRGAGRGRLG